MRGAASLAVRRSGPELLCLLVLAFGFVAAPWLRGRLIGQQGVAYYYTLLFFEVHRIRMGALPSWNPYVLSGYPQLADLPGTSLFYPLTIPLAMALPLRDAINAWIVLHLALAGWFMYLYLGTASLSRPARFLGAVVYMLSGFAAGRIFAGDDPARLAIYALVPLLFYLVEEIIQHRQRMGAAVLGGFIVACQFFAGDPQTFVYATLALLAYAMCRLVNIYRRQGGGVNDRAPAPAGPIRPALFLLAMFLVAGGFTAIQALPTLELFLLSNREGFDPSFAFLGSIPPLGLVSLIAPHLFGDEVHYSWGEAELRAPDFYPHASTLYVGFFTLALVITALVTRRDRWHVRFFGLLGLAVLWLALGKFGYVYRAVVYVPILRSFRDIENINILVPMSAAVLAGFGVDGYLEPARASDLWRNVRRILFFVVGAAAIFLEITLLHVWRTIGIVLLWHPPIRHAIVESVMFVLVAFSITAGLLWLRSLRPAVPTWQIAVVTFFVISDLMYAGLPFVGAGTDIHAAEEEDAVTRYLARDRSLYRVLGLSARTVLFGMQDVEGVAALLPARYSQYTNFLQGYAPDTSVRPGGFHGVLINRGLGSPLLDLLNVKYVILHAGGRDASKLRKRSGITEVAPGSFVYENPNFYPRVLDAYGYTVLRDRLTILRELSRAGYNPHQRVILEEPPQMPPGALPSGEIPDRPADLRVVSYDPNQVVIQARFARPGFLLLNDPDYPGWTASLDGHPTRIYRANYLFRAVVVPAGNHDIRFIYRDRALTVGVAVSGLAGIVGVIAWVVDRARRREPRAGQRRGG